MAINHCVNVRTIFSNGVETTEFITNSVRRTLILTMPNEVSFLHTSVGYCVRNTRMFFDVERQWTSAIYWKIRLSFINASKLNFKSCCKEKQNIYFYFECLSKILRTAGINILLHHSGRCALVLLE